MEITDSHVTVNRLETYRLIVRAQLSISDYVGYTKRLKMHMILSLLYAHNVNVGS